MHSDPGIFLHTCHFGRDAFYCSILILKACLACLFYFERTLFENSTLDPTGIHIPHLGINLFSHTICGGNHTTLPYGCNPLFDPRDLIVRMENCCWRSKTCFQRVEIYNHNWDLITSRWQWWGYLGRAIFAIRYCSPCDRFRPIMDHPAQSLPPGR